MDWKWEGRDSLSATSPGTGLHSHSLPLPPATMLCQLSCFLSQSLGGATTQIATCLLILGAYRCSILIGPLISIAKLPLMHPSIIIKRLGEGAEVGTPREGRECECCASARAGVGGPGSWGAFHEGRLSFPRRRTSPKTGLAGAPVSSPDTALQLVSHGRMSQAAWSLMGIPTGTCRVVSFTEVATPSNPDFTCCVHSWPDLASICSFRTRAVFPG